MIKTTPTATHWGNYLVKTEHGKIVGLDAYTDDLNPSPIRHSLESVHHACRVAGPMVRSGFLDNPRSHDRTQRGREPFVRVSWESAIELASEALRHTRQEFGNTAIYGGSYGWSSAGRFHHAQSQVHRFLSCFGGYTKSVDSYSLGAGRVILPRILGSHAIRAGSQAPTCEDIAQHTKLVVAFGGIAPKNTQVNAGGVGNHHAQSDLQKVKSAGVRYLNISPIRDDTAQFLDAEWWPMRPQSDVALMLALAYVLVVENLADLDFAKRYCVGIDEFRDYLTGQSDGVAKTPEWAAGLCELEPNQILSLARQMSAERTLISVSWSLQRSEHGEQTWWAGACACRIAWTYGLTRWWHYLWLRQCARHWFLWPTPTAVQIGGTTPAG